MSLATDGREPVISRSLVRCLPDIVTQVDNIMVLSLGFSKQTVLAIENEAWDDYRDGFLTRRSSAIRRISEMR